MKSLREAVAVVLAGVFTLAPTYGAGEVQPTKAIKHVVVIYQENVSFDHYFATYPRALNPPGEPRFVPRPGTPMLEVFLVTCLPEIQMFSMNRMEMVPVLHGIDKIVHVVLVIRSSVLICTDGRDRLWTNM